MKRRLKKEVVLSLYAGGILAMVGVLYGIERYIFPLSFNNKDNYEYVSKTIFDDVEPVVGDVKQVKKPFNDDTVKILKNYYNYKGEANDQIKSIIYNESTYLQSSGVTYSKDEAFDVVSILDGIVIDVKEDTLLGKIVEIRHSNDIISVYQGVNDVSVKLNDNITQGQVIAKSGTSNIFKGVNNLLYFELIVDGQMVNPEEYYNKKLSDL